MRNRRRNGFILLLVVALIPLIGVMSAVLTVNSRNLLIHTRLEELEFRAKAAFDSGTAWVWAHQSDENWFASDEGVVLEIKDDDDDDVTCTIRMVSRDAMHMIVQVTGKATDSRFSQEYQEEIVIGSP